MDIIAATLLDTKWGLILVGFIIFIAIIIEIFDNKPKI